MSWTDERVLMLKKFWADGLSASQIAKQLGSVTRNAVIGKIHRLGLAGRTTPTRPAKTRVRAIRPRAPVPATAAPRLRLAALPPLAESPTLEPLRFADGRAADVLSLRETMCKFPIGDPTDAAFAFCGRKTCVGPYCADHARLAYQPAQARRRRDTPPLPPRPMLRAAIAR